MTEECTGSRVGAGCDFVDGSLQRLKLLAGKARDVAHNVERAALGSEAASAVGLGVSKTKNAMKWLAAKIGFKNLSRRAAVLAGAVDVTEIGGKLNSGDLRGAAESSLSLGERLAGTAAGAAAGAQLFGVVGAPEVGAPIGAVVGTFAPEAMQEFNTATLDAAERGIDATASAVDNASQRVDASSLSILHQFVDEFRGPQ